MRVYKKKGDMNFWLVLGLLALIFMVVVFFVMNNIIGSYSETTGKVQKDVSEQIKDVDLDFNSGNDDKKDSSDG